MSNPAFPTVSSAKAVISGLGPDQPGIVAEISDLLFRYHCNIEDSTMTRLAREFAVILLISTPAEMDLALLQSELNKLESSHGMYLMVKPAPSHLDPDQPHLYGQPYMVSVAGDDRTGITQRVSRVLADLQVNITDLNAQVITGENGPVYIMMIEVALPEGVSADSVRTALNPLATELGVEIQLRPLEAVAL